MSVYDFTKFKNSKFAESIIYTPNGGAAVTINAVVFRNGAKGINARQGATVQYHPIIVQLDRTDITTVTEMKDTVTCDDLNGNSKTFVVRKIIDSDAGCFKVGL